MNSDELQEFRAQLSDFNESICAGEIVPYHLTLIHKLHERLLQEPPDQPYQAEIEFFKSIVRQEEEIITQELALVH